MAGEHVGDEPSKNHTIDARQGLTGGGLLAVTLLILAGAIVLFWLFPGLDLWASRLLYKGNHEFVGSHSAVLSVVRAFFNATFALTSVVAALGLTIAFRSGRSWLSLPFYTWLFLAICLGVGPGIVANLGLKDHWDRARPHNVMEFGGTKKFSSPIHPSDQCESHCSFVSGEASSIFVIFFAAALMFRRRSRTLIALGVVLGCATGFVRMAQGAHFLSDVVFAGILMAFTVAVIELIFGLVMPESRSSPQD
ncbi:MAG TPA: phosphatase PAP2 family protein [Hyphomicrobium sp.]|jgi:lipid A 4'-phosphatase|nr:phosphatase PAP2 family protein [Hyphomicrobium sp.]